MKAHDLSSPVYVAAFDWLAKRRAEIGSKSGKPACNAEWTVFSADGTGGGFYNGACHGGMSTPARSAELVANVSHWGSFRFPQYVDSYASGGWTKLLPQAEGERFYSWLVERSFASPYIAAPDLDFATNVGFVIRTDIPGNVALAICTLGRNCSEQAHIVKRWLHLIDAGASEDLAYVLAFGTNPDARWGRVVNGHNIVSASSLAYVENFVNHRIVHTTAPMTADGGTYGVEKMWGESPRGGSTLAADLQRFAAKKETSEVVINNPFKHVVSRAAACTDALIESAIPNLMEYLYANDVRKPHRQAA